MGGVKRWLEDTVYAVAEALGADGDDGDVFDAIHDWLEEEGLGPSTPVDRIVARARRELRGRLRGASSPARVEEVPARRDDMDGTRIASELVGAARELTGAPLSAEDEMIDQVGRKMGVAMSALGSARENIARALMSATSIRTMEKRLGVANPRERARIEALAKKLVVASEMADEARELAARVMQDWT